MFVSQRNMTKNQFEIDVMHLHIHISRMVTHLDVICNKSVRLGNTGDGGWEVCVVEPYRPEPPCLIYSFG